MKQTNIQNYQPDEKAIESEFDKMVADSNTLKLFPVFTFEKQEIKIDNKDYEFAFKENDSERQPEIKQIPKNKSNDISAIF